MSDNLKIWDALAKTNPEHTKSFKRRGGFEGTAIKPIYAIHKMTQHFGAVGEGWGYLEPKFQIVDCGAEKAVYCTLAVWHRTAAGEPSQMYFGVGGDFIVTTDRNGQPRADDEAFKKAFTDALTNAMKHLGVSADIHFGQFDGNKYVAGNDDPMMQSSAPKKAAAAPSSTPPVDDATKARALEWAKDIYENVLPGFQSADALATWQTDKETMKRLGFLGKVSPKSLEKLGAAINLRGQQLLGA